MYGFLLLNSTAEYREDVIINKESENEDGFVRSKFAEILDDVTSKQFIPIARKHDQNAHYCFNQER